MKKFLIAAVLSVTLAFASSTAFAHKFVVAPDNFNVPAGGAAGISVTFTEIIGVPEYSLSATGAIYSQMDTSFEVRYKGGTVSAILNSTFKPYSSKTMTAGDIEESDVEYAKFGVTNTGTAVVNASFRGTVDLSKFGGEGTSESISHSKTFLNLTNDGMATTRLGGNDVLEVVFAQDAPAGGFIEGAIVKFQFFLNGAPLQNAPVFASYVGAPTHTIKEGDNDVEVNDYLEATTDGNGMASFTLDQEAAWFVGAFHGEGTSQEYGGGVMFPVSGEYGIEGDITLALIEAGKNNAGISFPIWTGGDKTDLISEKWGFATADGLAATPKGTTEFLLRQANQLPGIDTGAKISIPLDIRLAGTRGLIGFGQRISLTPAMLGKDTFDSMSAFLKSQYAAFERDGTLQEAMFFPEDGKTWYVPYTPEVLFDQFDIAVMARFSDEEVRDVTGDFQIGVVYDEATIGDAILINYGGMVADSAPDGGNYSIDVTNDLYPGFSPYKWAFIYDGKEDDSINFSYWLATTRTQAGGSGGGGCATGSAALAGLVLMAGIFCATYRKRG
ncbi:MAG: DUF4198 domain-containing protein [Synergistaceae bacterium]|jgi:hypothetical protein|nr:DUF4198 domain-containing protein [Synergistaceae bacterium]